MKNSIFLKSYFSLIALEFIALFFGLNYLHIIVNVLAAPLILFIYFRVVKLSYQWYFVIVLLSLYATNISHIVAKLDINNIFCVFLNSMAYGVLTFFVLKNFEFKKQKNLDPVFYISFLIIFSLFSYILWVVNDILIEQKVNNYILFFIYSCFVFVMSTIVSFIFLVKPNICNTNLQISIFCFITSNLFYLIHIIYSDIEIFKYFLFLPQLIVYYFLLKYELNRNKIFEVT